MQYIYHSTLNEWLRMVVIIVFGVDTNRKCPLQLVALSIHEATRLTYHIP